MNERKNLSASEKMRAALPSEPRDKRTSPVLVFLTGLLSMLMILACCVCGGAAWWFRPQLRENPEDARRLVAEIAEIRIPDSLQARGTIDWNMAYLMTLRGAYFERFVGDGVLTLLEVSSRFAQDESIRQHIRQKLLEEGGNGAELVVDASRRRTDKFGPGEIPFTFELARDPRTAREYHLVDGVFEGRAGPVLLTLRVDDEHWKDEAGAGPGDSQRPCPNWVTGMLNSINSPGAANPPPVEPKLPDPTPESAPAAEGAKSEASNPKL
jgi:hypothetical protein